MKAKLARWVNTVYVMQRRRAKQIDSCGRYQERLTRAVWVDKQDDSVDK